MKYNIKKIDNITNDIEVKITAIWKAAVLATHDFLSDDNIMFYEKYIGSALHYGDVLLGVFEDNDGLVAFSLVKDNKIEMLFVKPDYFRAGIGRELVKYVLNNLKVQYVDCNEQNPQGVKFYQKMGFEIFKRSPKDEEGNDFPILHMIYKKH